MKSAVLLLVFNRPEITEVLIDILSQARPQRLYIACDGPRVHSETDSVRVEQVRSVVARLPWRCQVFRNYRETNLGSRHAVTTAIDWFFENESSGIILEDDCHPSSDFFDFCDEMLEKYADSPNVSMISGNAFVSASADASYHFSAYSNIWGWATWRRAWRDFDVDMSFWPEWENSRDWKLLMQNKVELNHWSEIFSKVHAQHPEMIDVWDYSWTATNMWRGKLSVAPNVNLVSNVGFGPDATHTRSEYRGLKSFPTGQIFPIVHPEGIVRDEVRDALHFDRVIRSRASRFPHSLLPPNFISPVRQFRNRWHPR